MADYTTKAEDSYPVFTRTLGVDLSTADEVRLYVYHVESDTLVVGATMTVEAAETGEVSYKFSAGETARLGSHVAEVVVDWGDGTQTFPETGKYLLTFNEAIDKSADPESTLTKDVSIGSLALAGDLSLESGQTVVDYATATVPKTVLGGPAGSLSAYPLGTTDIADGTITNAKLAGSFSISHSELTGIAADDHHTRYTDAEAVSAVNTDADHGSSAPHDYFSGNHADLFGVSADDHHVRYSDSEAVAAINADPGHGSNAPHDYFSGAHSDLTGVSADDHHTRYSDTEAQDAVGSLLSSAFSYTAGTSIERVPQVLVAGKTSHQSETVTNTYTTITWDTPRLDTINGLDGATGQFTPQKDGVYRITARVTVAAQGNSNGTTVIKNMATGDQYAYEAEGFGSLARTFFHIETVRDLKTTDVIEIQTEISHEWTALGSAVNQECELSIDYLGSL